jgi:predicted phage terminase large subunit-like protein
VKTTYPDFRFAIHNLLVMDALTYVQKGYLNRFALMMPPRHGKTLLNSILFPAFVLGHNPSARIILASYSQQLAVLNSRAIRDIVRSPAYLKIFPAVQIREDKASEREWETTRGGGLLAVGVGSGLTGRGCDLLVCDDLVKDAEEANSQIILEGIFQWYATVARTRLQPGGKIVSVMTRWSINDLMGRVFQEGRANKHADQWKTIKLPALAAEHDPLGRPPGAALWPDAYDIPDLLAVKALDEKNFDALYQQTPQSSADKKFNRDDIQIVDSFPLSETASWCRSWDLAITDNESSDYLAGALVAAEKITLPENVSRVLDGARMAQPYRLHVDDLIRNRGRWPEQRIKIIETALEDGAGVPVIIEATRMDLAAAQQLADDLRLLGCTVRRVKPRGDKVARKGPLQVITENKRLSFKRALWNEDALREFDEFPNGLHDDMVDAIEQACGFLTKPEFEMAVL